MREFDEATITEAVLEQVANTPNLRARQVGQALIRHLHAFIREVEPTEAEWEWGIRFLTETGQLCSDTRQEFILLSDTLGASMLVDTINHRLPSGATETTVFGPFYTAPPEFQPGADISGHLQGRPMHVAGRVADPDGRPLAGAVVDVWHSDDQGFYDLQKFGNDRRYAGRGRFRSGEDGQFHFWTIRPTAYPIPDDGPVGKMLRAQNRHPYRPEHIHFMVVAPGHQKLVTHIFAAGDRYLDSDVVFGVKKSLVEEYRAHHGGKAPDGCAMDGNWFSLDREFRLAPLAC